MIRSRGVVLASAVLALGLGLARSAQAAARRARPSLFATQVVTADIGSLRRRLEPPVDFSRPLESDTHVPHDGEASSLVLFKGCRANAAGACRVTAVFTLAGPGGVVKPRQRAVLWAGRAPARGALSIGRRAATFRFAPHDPAGRYRLEARVTDAVSGASFSVSTPFHYD
ncbi:MAG: hypothetical protein INR64_01970 [Caulobacteraceae bacterium]|nr:hypothetical protein [Caulobacter sp.]